MISRERRRRSVFSFLQGKERGQLFQEKRRIHLTREENGRDRFKGIPLKKKRKEGEQPFQKKKKKTKKTETKKRKKKIRLLFLGVGREI